MTFKIYNSSGGNPCRGEMHDDIWTIDIKSLEELLELVNKCDDKSVNYEGLIIKPSRTAGLYEVEVYDYYRE